MFLGKPFYIIVFQVYAPTINAEEDEVKLFYEELHGLELTSKKDVLFIIGNWNAKVGSQEIPGVTGKFGLRVQNEAEQKANTVLSREHTGHSKHPLPRTQETINGHHQMVKIKIRLIIFFAAEDGNALYSQQKQDLELSVAQIIRSSAPYCKIQAYIEESRENH